MKRLLSWLKDKIQDWWIKNVDEAPMPKEHEEAWPQDPYI